MSTALHKEGPAIGPLHEVRATFADPDAMQEAVSRLETAGFDRADLSLPEVAPPVERDTPEWGAKAVDTEPDARQARTLHVSGAAAAVALGAAAVVIAFGASVGWAIVAAIVGAIIAGGVVYLLSSAANQSEQMDREFKAATGTLVLSVRSSTEAKRIEAQAILRAAGGTEVRAV
jgi:Flp pilus assembly protein TadB